MGTILQGDCIEEMKKLPENSVDAIITDPPYGLSFMGKKWDYDVPSVELWKEVLRVMKPGAFLLSFAGTRTYHRMAVNIEDAGFEIRDMISWLYGSGFPKSLNIGKQIDKLNGRTREDFIELGKCLEEMRGEQYNKKELGKKIFDFDSNREDVPIHTFESGKDIPTQEIYNKLKEILGLDNRFDELIKRIEAKREVIGKKTSGLGSGETYAFTEKNYIANKEVDITAPNLLEAKEWEGWGTALKPACEPIVVARKPLSEKNVALNVLKWGTGGINIDDCRVGTEKHIVRGGDENTEKFFHGGFKQVNKEVEGRFPANIILDEEAGEILDEQTGNSLTSGNVKEGTVQGFSDGGANIYGDSKGVTTPRNSSKGGASRFFYCAKASKSERNYGCEEMEEKNMRYEDNRPNSMEIFSNQYTESSGNPTGRGITHPRANNHPTVKPIKLMEYLVKLVSKEGSTVLDPFLGSGTTAIACEKLGRKWIGIEREEDYIKIAKARLKPFIEQTKLGSSLA